MDKFDIVLVSPPSRMINHYRPPLALMYVANYYVKKRLKVKIIDIPMKQIVRTKKFWNSRKQLIEEIELEMLNQIHKIETKVIGISCYSPELEEVKSFIEKIRKISDATIFVGGIHPTLQPQDFDKISDFAIKGRLDNGYPAYSLVDMRYYSLPNPYSIRGVFLSCAYIVSSFGCPSSCTFCVAPKLREFYKISQLKTPKNLVREIEFLKKEYKIDSFYFIDDLYTINKKNVLEFCQLIKSTQLLWGCNAKVTTLDEEMIKAMAEANCIQLDLGIERGSNEALKEVKKGITIEKVKEVCNLCKRYKIRVFANYLVGLPQETESEREDILRLAHELKSEVISINPFTPYFGTEIYEKGIREGNEKNSILLKWIEDNMKKYNSIWVNLKFHFSKKYLSMLWRSKRKLDYLTQLPIILMEVLNQKWN